MQDVIVPISAGVAATAFVWILCAIVVRVRANARKKRQEDTIEKISRILEAAFKGAKLLDEEESLQYVKSVEELMNKNMPILGTDFLIILDKYLLLLRNYIKEVKAAAPKPSEKAKGKTIEAPQESKQNVKPQTRIEIETKPEIKPEIPQTKINIETNDETSYLINTSQEFEMIDIPKGSAKNNS